ncbi:MAG: hypothetical protein UU79_C0005G0049, partial [candidate division WWE3 bacterium GW2011_GWE1_41_72]
ANSPVNSKRFVHALKRLINKHVYIVAFSAIYLAASLLLYKDFGVTYDEKVEYDAGKYLSAYLVTPTTLEYTTKLVNDKSDNIKYSHQLPLFSTYSRVYPALLNILNPSYYFEWFHLQNLILGLFLFLFSYAILYLVYDDGSRAIVGPALLLLTPAVSGHIPANPKDIPFATIFLLGILLITYFMKYPKNKSVEILALGVVFGIAQSMRIVGATLFVVYVLFSIFRLVLDTYPNDFTIYLGVKRTFFRNKLFCQSYIYSYRIDRISNMES